MYVVTPAVVLDGQGKVAEMLSSNLSNRQQCCLLFGQGHVGADIFLCDGKLPMPRVSAVVEGSKRIWYAWRAHRTPSHGSKDRDIHPTSTPISCLCAVTVIAIS